MLFLCLLLLDVLEGLLHDKVALEGLSKLLIHFCDVAYVSDALPYVLVVGFIRVVQPT